MYLITLACLQYIKKLNVQNLEYFYHHYVKSELYLPVYLQQVILPVYPDVQIHSRCSVSSVNRSARSATVSTAASECFMVVLVWLELKKKPQLSPPTLECKHPPIYLWSLTKMSTVQLTIFCYYSYFFSAVFSIACILSSMVDLMRNLWTNVGLVDRENNRNQTECTKHWRHMFNIKVNTVRIIATIEALTSKTHKYDSYGKNN